MTVLVQTKNEELGLETCLSALTDFDEVIVVDSNSTDRTKQIALDCGATVVNFTWNKKYPKKKQWELDNVVTKHDWVLFIDADETPNAELIRSLFEFSRTQLWSAAAIDIRLDYVFGGRMLRHGHRVVKRALVHKDRVQFPVVDDLDAPGMGELEGHYQPEAQGQIRTMPGRIRHDDKDPVRTWFDRHNRYSDWEAYLRTNNAVKSAIGRRRSAHGRVFDKVPFKPLAFFLYAYVIRAGFLDGRAGFDYAIALSTYYWQIGLKLREIHRDR